MSEKTEQTVDTELDSGDVEMSAADLKIALEKATGEIAKERSIRKKLQSERDSWKKEPAKSEDGENFKELYQKQVEELNVLKNKAKTKDIDSAVRAQLLKVGILPDAVEAATKLIDNSFISYDEDAGVDVFGVETAVKDLKSKMKFMFETKVDATKTRLADSGKGADPKEMSRAEWSKLPLPAQREAARKFKIID
jgi:hypothetical protein